MEALSYVGLALVLPINMSGEVSIPSFNFSILASSEAFIAAFTWLTRPTQNSLRPLLKCGGSIGNIGKCGRHDAQAHLGSDTNWKQRAIYIWKYIYENIYINIY